MSTSRNPITALTAFIHSPSLLPQIQPRIRMGLNHALRMAVRHHARHRYQYDLWYPNEVAESNCACHPLSPSSAIRTDDALGL